MSQPLALEIYQLIIAHVDDTIDLLSLALCCSAFRDEAQRCLFRHVDARSFHRHTPFPAAINSSPLRLGPLVHTLDFTPLLGLNTMDRSWTVPFSLALRAMPNLKHLAIDRVNPSTVLQDCTFNLRTLYCGSLLHESEVLFVLCTFLPTQPSMKCLQIMDNVPFDMAEVPIDLCPDLDSLGVRDADLVSTFLRDTRLITRFEWYSWLFPKITIPQLKRLEYLLFSIDQLLNVDTSFTSNLTSLVHLELHVKLNTPDALSHEIQFLQNMPRLQALVFQIDGMFLNKTVAGGKLGDEYHLRTEYTSAYQHAFELCPTLKHIDAGNVDNPIYNRFFRLRNGENGELVSDRFVHEREVMEWKVFV